MEEIELGDTFLILDGSGKRHLYVVIAVDLEDNYLLVNITTPKRQINPNKDCVINPGEGVTDFVVHQSIVAYDYAREFRKNNIKKLIREGKCKPDGRFSEEILQRIQKTGASSKSLKKKYKNILEEVIRSKFR